MFKRALIIALWGAYAAAIAPLAIPADDDCALYLTGPGRSSAYDYSLNLLKGNFGYEGQHTCITYDAINQAYLDARNRILVSQPKDHWKAEDFASVGELVLDISIQLARTYGLTYEEIEKGLPLIDTSRTLIREVCPPVFSHVECRAGKYRRLDGLCNNLQHPTWGATMAPFQRLIGPLFSDGINAPRISHSGHDLPLSRVVSRTMHPDDGFHDHAGTVMVIAWGQFMDHDFTLTGTPLDPVHRNDPEECCKRPPHLKHPYCNEIRIPEDDYFYRLFGVKCMDFVRGFPSPRPGCRLGSRNPFNTLTGSIDGNTVYGVTDKFSRKLRTGYGGLLRMNPVFKEYGLKDLLPLKLDIPDEGCTRPNKNMYCFEAGEIRVNEQLVLTVMHTLMAREHNRVAEALAAVNPHWDDEMLFQEARRINIAEIQHITYNEFLPILLGKDVMEKFGLVLEKQGYWNGYDPEVNPDVLASFAAAAYRFGHSLLPTAVERWSKAHKFIASKRLSDLIRRPYDLYRAGVLDEYVMGLMNQVAQAMDDSITQEVTNHLFKKVGARFGMDLVSLNMQRGREFGLPGYMEFRKFCGLSGAESFGDLYGSMPNETVRKYETIFEHPIDVDLWSGGVSERPLPGSMLGPTFACIIATQFSYSRRGDRFWFELPNQPSSFTPEQLAEIRKSRLARIICDNTDIIDTVQLYPMVLPDHELNPRVPCRSGIIPQMDFSKWADPLPFHGAAKQFVTDAIVLLNEKQNNTIVKTLKNTKQDENKEKNDVVNINCSNLILPIKEQDSVKNENNTDCFGNSTENVIDDNMKKNGEEPCIQKLDDTKQITNNLLKYIYKKNDKVTNNQKSNGHFKNKLKRKKRSPLDTPNTDSKNNVLPVMIDYVTSHQTKDKNNLFLPVTVTGKTVQSSNLADFNIETIHSSVIKPSDVENKKNTEIKYHGPTTNNVSFPSESIETNDREFSGDKHYERLKNQEDKDISSSLEEYREEITSKSSEYDKESTEKDNSKISNPVESEEYSSAETHSFTKSPLKNNNENTKSEDDESIEHKYQSTSNINKKPLHLSSHEVLDDVNSKSDEEDNFQKKTHDKYSENKTMNSSANLRTDHNESNESNSAENKESYEDSHSQEDINKSQKEKQTHINDAEVKPVVELNNESSESSEENLQEPNNIQSNKRDKLVTYSTDDVIKTDKDIISASNDDIEKIDVKQQFERIPLDYNHADKRKDQNSVNETKIPITEQRGTDEDKEGTLDTLLPTYPSYDDKLNTKFHDLTIKLPEIKLPDDILSFAYEGPHYETKKDKNANKRKLYYNYNEDDSHEKDEQVKSEDDFDKFYKRSNGFTNDDNNENQKSREDNNEDLYEKFVRERFGKKSFKERSEKLQALEINSPKSKLHKTFKDILKKTKDVQKEAERNKDPNSNYMWTLEYGETL